MVFAEIVSMSGTTQKGTVAFSLHINIQNELTMNVCVVKRTYKSVDTSVDVHNLCPQVHSISSV